MKMNNKIMISALALAMGAALAGSVSGTVAWYQYSTRVLTSYVGTSAKCAENLQISLDGTNFKSELLRSDFASGARENKDGSALMPITFGAEQVTGTTAASDPALVETAPYKHPKYQNFAYSTWGTAEADSYLQYDLYFRVLDVNGTSTASYLAKKLYFEDITLNYTPAQGVTATDTDAFKNALRIQFDQITPTGAKRILLSNTARTSLKLGGELDLNSDGASDKTAGYVFGDSDTRTAGEYGDKTVLQNTEAFSAYKAKLENGSLTPVVGQDENDDDILAKELGSTVSGTYDKTTALHFVVTVWLEGWDGTQIWDAANYIGSFQLGMTFGITDYGQA